MATELCEKSAAMRQELERLKLKLKELQRLVLKDAEAHACARALLAAADAACQACRSNDVLKPLWREADRLRTDATTQVQRLRPLGRGVPAYEPSFKIPLKGSSGALALYSPRNY